MESILTDGNHISWQSEPRYCASVADELAHAQTKLARANRGITGFREVVDALYSWQHVMMSSQQFEQLHFILGFAYSKLGEHRTAIDHYSHALEVATRLRTRYGAEAVLHSYELLYLRAIQYRAVGRYVDASGDLRLALALLHEFVPENQQTLPELQLRLLAQLAGYTFFQGHYDTSERFIISARKLIPLAPKLHYEAALVTWADAHLARALGKPDRALTIATQVLPIIDRADACTQVRFHAFLADVALDAAQQLSDVRQTKAYDRYIHIAQQHVQAADTQMTGDDVSGVLLAWLIRMRQYRLAGRNYDRVADIEVVMRQGRLLADYSLIVQAMMALGDEFASQRMPEAALSCYRQVLGALDGSQEQAIGLRALRNVRNDEEWRTDD